MDIDALLEPISGVWPCGEPDIDYDPRFAEMERAAKGKESQQMGDSVSEGEPPDWKTVSALAQELLGQAHDLRILVYLGRAQLHLEGIASFAKVLQAILRLLEESWDNLYPELDEDDNNDPTLRVNSLLALRDQDGVLLDVAQSPLVSVKGIGSFSQHDIRVALGEIPGADDAPPIELINGAFMEVPVEELQSLSEGIRQVREAAGKIEALLTDKVGAANSVDLTPLSDMLSEPERIVIQRLGERGVAVESSAPQEGESAGGDAVAAAPQAPQPPQGINNREDVIRALHKIYEYYDREEPSSPVPLLLRRAEGLVHKGFMEIMRDIAPDGVSNAEVIVGESYDS